MMEEVVSEENDSTEPHSLVLSLSVSVDNFSVQRKQDETVMNPISASV